MFFRNLTLFRFPATMNFGQLPDLLPECAMKPVGALEWFSRGFVSPLGRDSGELVRRVGDAIWLTVGGEHKILPDSVVNDQLAKRLAAIEMEGGRKPGGKTRKRIKDDLFHELLPKAFVKPSRTDAYIDTRRGFIAVNTPSKKTAEAVVAEIRYALGSFPALPLEAEASPRAVLTGWLAGEPLPDGLRLGDECELRSPAKGDEVITFRNINLRSDEIGGHLGAGLQCARLELTMEDRMAFVLGEDLTLRKLKFFDGALDQFESTEHDDPQAELDARFALMSGEIGRLFDVLEPALKLAGAEAMA